MTVIYRPAELNDIPGVAKVHAAALNKLNQRHGARAEATDTNLLLVDGAFSQPAHRTRCTLPAGRILCQRTQWSIANHPGHHSHQDGSQSQAETDPLVFLSRRIQSAPLSL